MRSVLPGSSWLLCCFLFGCSPSAVLLSQGSVRVTFTGEQTCGFDNPYVAQAKGCRWIDKKAVMCNGFGVIDGVLFAGGCEAPARYELLETRGTLPVAPDRGQEESR
ncbi:MAG: hypothetical protein ABI895_31230 [Deltaproteobacteria bacterium]